MSILSVENLNVKYNGKKGIHHIVQNISFSVEEGGCLCILGESGSGKSTLGRIITGLLKPTSGQYVFLDKEPYLNNKNRKFLSERICVVFQDYTTSVNPRFSAAEILKEPLTLLGRRNHQKLDYDKKVKDLLQLVELDSSFARRFPHQLSGGQLQRLCIARAVAIQPQIILFDEAG